MLPGLKKFMQSGYFNIFNYSNNLDDLYLENELLGDTL